MLVRSQSNETSMFFQSASKHGCHLSACFCGSKQQQISGHVWKKCELITAPHGLGLVLTWSHLLPDWLESIGWNHRILLWYSINKNKCKEYWKIQRNNNITNLVNHSFPLCPRNYSLLRVNVWNVLAYNMTKKLVTSSNIKQY